MPNDGEPTVEKAVIDRTVDGTRAVLTTGDPPEREQIVPVERLPSGAVEGTWLKVRFERNTLIDAQIEKPKTDSAKDRIRGKMQRLRRRRG